MQTVTGTFLAALRGPHTLDVLVQAFRNNVRVGGTLNVLGGQVSAAASLTSSPRRSISVDLAPAKGLWDALAPAGTTLKAWRGVRYIDGTVERVPLGVFDIDEQAMGYGTDGRLTLTAPDLWVRVQRAKFETLRTTPNGASAVTTAITYATEATGTSVGANIADTSVTVTQQQWTGDRDAAITELLKPAGAWVYCDVNGLVSARPVPSLAQTPVWTVDASASGVMLDASRSRNRQRSYNVVIVSGGDTNGTAPFADQIVEDTNVNSPTYVGGSFGRVPYFVSTATLSTTAQAITYGKSLLRRVTGMAAQLEMTSVVNPALEPGDSISVLLPARSGDVPKVERHLIDSITIPLTADDTQSIQTRSSRPEGDVEEGA